MNKDRREKMRKWFYSALLPCVSSKGIVRVVGTILHMDSLLERLMPKPHDRASVQEPLKLWSRLKKNGWWSVKYRAHSDDFTHVLWPEKCPKEWLKQKRDEYIGMGMPDVYSQEYLNVPLDESKALFKRADFVEQSEEDKQVLKSIYITVDLAIAEHERADYSVFLVAGVDENRRIHVLDVIKARLDGREIVDTIISLQRIYDPVAFGIEEMQVSKSIGPFLNEEMIKENQYPSIYKLKHGGKDKILRCRSIQARLRAKTVKFNKAGDWYQDFEEELIKFPRDVHDDQVDAFAYLGMLLDKLIEAPTKAEQEEEDLYADESNESNYSGRCAVTGY